MAFALIIIGLVLLISAVNSTHSQLFALVKGDFTGPSNFTYWVVAILIVGAVGYVPKAKPLSTAFMGLILVGLFLSKGGFFSQFTSALQSTTTVQANTATTNTNTSTPSVGSILGALGTLNQTVGSQLIPSTPTQQQTLSLPNLPSLTPLVQ